MAILSGGQKTRLGLAQLLISDPQLLLLDEPTNHLDITALEWLETWLAGYPGAALIVSHDRTFLDKVTEMTWELSFGRLDSYKGNYSFYLKEKAERFNQDTEIQALLAEINADDGTYAYVNDGYSADTAANLKAVDFDRGARGARSGLLVVVPPPRFEPRSQEPSRYTSGLHSIR